MDYKAKQRKLAAARKAVARANAVLAARSKTVANSNTMLSPINRGGFGPYSKRLPFYRQSELKAVDVPLTTNVISTTGYFNVLNVPQVGAAFYNRVGNEIEMKSLHLVGNITCTGAASAGAVDYCRIMIIYDRQPNGSYPVTADVLTSYATAGTTTSTSYDHLNPNNFDRFKVLADIRFESPGAVVNTTTDVQAQAIDYKSEAHVNRFINLRGLSTKFKASTGAIGDISSGSILMFMLGQVAAATAPFAFNYSTRLRYVD